MKKLTRPNLNSINLIEYQKQKVFFDITPDRQRPDLPLRPTDDEIRVYLAQNNQNCPLNSIVVSKKNEQPMHILRLAAFKAFQSHNHSVRGLSFGIYSGPGQGKTSLVKAWAATIGIPFILVQSSSLKTTWQLFEQIRAAFTKAGFPLVPQTNEFHFVIPPVIVLLDETHDLSIKLRTGGLLNPMEANDGWLVTAPEGRNQKQYYVDCQEVCWVSASTDPGIIFSQSQAFYDRFSNHLIWHGATRAEISQIVKQNHPELPESACNVVAFYRRNPRKAKAFAEQMKIQQKMMGCTWDEAALKIAEINQIDEFGMEIKQVWVLKALAQRPIAKQHLAGVAQCRKEELESMILPPLMADEDRGALITTTQKGFALTRAGLEEVKKRNLPYNTDERCILAEYILY